jgi:WD40 repeat protein
MFDIQGRGLRQITRKGASTPRWSPDGRTIAYESPAAGEPDIYVFDTATNREHRITFGSGSNLRPSWSRNGRFVYFGSSRTGESQIWKVPSNGGKETQVTHQGGTYAVESIDGRSIYFTSPSQPPSVRVKRLDSEDENILVEGAIGFSSISMGNGGFFYLKSLVPTGARLNFFNFGSKTNREIAQIELPVHHFLSSPPDGNSVLFTQVDREDRDLMLARLH